VATTGLGRSLKRFNKSMFAARMVSKVPWMPSSLSWVEAMSHPAVMDTTRAKTELGWEPRYTGIEALRDTLR